MRDNAKSIQCYIQFLSWCYNFDDVVESNSSVAALVEEAEARIDCWKEDILGMGQLVVAVVVVVVINVTVTAGYVVGCASMVAVTVMLGDASVVRPSECRNNLFGRTIADVAMVVLVVTAVVDATFVIWGVDGERPNSNCVVLNE